MDYAIWRACERIGIRPPDVKESWDDCNIIAQSMLIAYSQLRDYEEDEEKVQMMKARI